MATFKEIENIYLKTVYAFQEFLTSKDSERLNELYAYAKSIRNKENTDADYQEIGACMLSIWDSYFELYPTWTAEHIDSFRRFSKCL